VRGSRRLSIGMPCKTGLIWAFDAASGEFVWAKQTVVQNLVRSVDERGQVTVNEDMVMKVPGKTYALCPTFTGGRDWPASAYNPTTNVMFFPLNNMCSNTTPRAIPPNPSNVYAVDHSDLRVADGFTNVGRIDAVSVETGDTVWSYEQPAGLYSPILATAGDLLFTGGVDRYFRAIDQSTGNVMWQTRLPVSVHGHATTYSIAGRQYIAVIAGGVALATRPMQLSPPGSDPVTSANALFVFALPSTAPRSTSSAPN
jgi:alcohol dehydrogenase (cytochrome c)